jgi:cysteinyl-tRNA synthetase
MDQDFGTAAGVATLFDAVRRANLAFDSDDAPHAAALVAAVRLLLDVLGFADVDEEQTDDAAEIDAMVQARTDARTAKDFAAADRIRDELASRGVVIEDTATGTTWHR